jgi:prophage regulatory protein
MDRHGKAVRSVKEKMRAGDIFLHVSAKALSTRICQTSPVIKHVWRCEMAEKNRALKILRIRQVQDRTGLSRSTIYDRLDPRSPRYDCNFPKPMKIGLSAVGWPETSINEWIERCFAA